MQQNNILNILRLHYPALCQKYPIQSMALFGSYARNDATENSDLDLLVTFNSSSVGYEYLDLYFDLQQIFTGKKIDLVTPQSIPLHYQQFIEPDLLYV